MALPDIQRSELIGLYIAMFQAAPGADYLAQLVEARAAGASLLDIATALASKPQFQLGYPASEDVKQVYLDVIQHNLAQRIIDNLLADDTPADARNWATSWALEKLRADASIASVILDAARALMGTDNPAYASAKTLMLNRIEVAAHYSVTHEQSSVDYAALKNMLVNVTPDPASVVAAKAAIDANLGSTAFILTTGTDNLVGTAGDDHFIAGFNATVFTPSDKLNGGAGTDTLTLYTTPLINNGFPDGASVSNIEVLNVHFGSNDGATVDASKFSGVSVINLVSGDGLSLGDNNRLLNVTASQEVTIQGDSPVDVYAQGYHPATDESGAIYGGTLNVTFSAPSAHLYAETLNVTVKASKDISHVLLDGDAEIVRITLVPTLDDNGSPDDSKDDQYITPSVLLAASGLRPSYSYGGLTTITVSGNGSAVVSNTNSAQVSTVDASTLESKDGHGELGAGLTYFSVYGGAETIKLSGGLDYIYLGSSNVDRTDTIYNFSLVNDARTAGKQVDWSQSDRLELIRYATDPAAGEGFMKAEIYAHSLDEALNIIAASADDKVVFHFAGDTYVYRDLSGWIYDVTGREPEESSFYGNDVVDANDVLVKLVGILDLDLMVELLGA